MKLLATAALASLALMGAFAQAQETNMTLKAPRAVRISGPLHPRSIDTPKSVCSMTCGSVRVSVCAIAASSPSPR